MNVVTAQSIGRLDVEAELEKRRLPRARACIASLRHQRAKAVVIAAWVKTALAYEDEIDNYLFLLVDNSLTKGNGWFITTKDAVVEYLRANGASSGAAIAYTLGVSRQAINRWLRRLVDDGIVRKIGETRGARYHLLALHEETPTPSRYERTLTLQGLEEDGVFAEPDIVLALSSKL